MSYRDYIEAVMSIPPGEDGGLPHHDVSQGEYRGVRYRIRKVAFWYCAYIEVPENTVDDNVDCHGDVTFVSYAGWPPSEDELKPGCKIVGWDYNHLGDYDMHYTEEDVLRDIKYTIDKLKKE